MVAIIPRVILAVVVLILGLSFAGFAAEVVQTTAANVQIARARMLANLTRGAMTVFVVILALNQLDIGTDVLDKAFLILFGSVCFGLSLAFGLGCRDLAGRIAERAWEREQAQTSALSGAATKKP